MCVSATAVRQSGSLVAAKMACNDIRCIVFSEFEVKLGPQIAFQVSSMVYFSGIMTAKVPEGYISKDEFTAVKKFLIPKPELCDRLIVMCDAGSHGAMLTS